MTRGLNGINAANAALNAGLTRVGDKLALLMVQNGLAINAIAAPKRMHFLTKH